MGIISRCVVLALSAVAAAAGGLEPKVSPTALSQPPFLPARSKTPVIGFGSGFQGVSRQSGIAKSGKIDALRKRIKSVGNSQKITTAMKLVAAAKVRKAQEAVTRSLPFSEMLDKVAANLMQQLSLENIEMPILEQRPLRKVTLVSITGDRGLCGPYNSAMIKLTEKRAQELEKLGIPFEIIPVGKKGTIYFKRREQYSVPETFDCPQNPTAEYAKGIADMLFQKYVSGETDRVEILYSKFESLIATTPTIRTMLPLSPAELAKGEDGKKKKKKTEDEDATKDPGFTPNMVLDQEPATLLNVIVPLYVNGQVLKTIQDAVASELASRMTAMQSASDNARDLLKELGLVTNRARQAEVTQSIMEVVAGANAGE